MHPITRLKRRCRVLLFALSWALRAYRLAGGEVAQAEERERMKIEDLRRQAVSRLETGRLLGIDDPFIILAIPRKWRAPARFPRGTWVADNCDGSQMRSYRARRILKWCDLIAALCCIGVDGSET